MVVADVVGILASDSLEGNLYLFDNNRTGGSVGEGTGQLNTRLKFREGDQIDFLWNVMSLEPEAYVSISLVEADPEYFEITSGLYPGSDIGYWKGKVNKVFGQQTYRLSLKVGSREREYTCELGVERI